MGWRSPPPAPSLFTTAKEAVPEDTSSPETLQQGRGACKAKTLSTIMLRCSLSFVTSATCLLSGESMWTFTQVGCSHHRGYRDRLDTEAGVRIHLSFRKQHFRDLQSVEMPPIPQNTFWKCIFHLKCYLWDFPGGPVVKNPRFSAGNVNLIPDQGMKIPHAKWGN